MKIVKTFDSDSEENGWLMELYKKGDKTLVYLTALKEGAFKGYHYHKVRASHYVCIKGSVKVEWKDTRRRRSRILTVGDSLSLPKRVPIGLENIGQGEAWLVNFPKPAYDPNLKGEQVEYNSL